MQLVGATEGFIIKPFMKYFVVQGVIGGILSLVLLTIFLVKTTNDIPELMQLTNFGSFAVIYIAVMILGVLLTTLSTFFAMRKYLRADVDELYE